MSVRGPSPRTRLSPIPEDLLATFTDHAAAAEAWDPNSRRASVERALKIRACTDLAGVLNLVPLTYRGIISKCGSDLMAAIDTLDGLQRRKRSWDSLKAKGELPQHYNSIKKVPHVQFPKQATQIYKTHFMLPAESILTNAAKEMFVAELKALDNAIIEAQERTDTRRIFPVVWKAVQDKYAGRKPADNWALKTPTAQDQDWPMEVDDSAIEVSLVDYFKREKEALQKDLEIILPKIYELKYDSMDRARRDSDKKTERSAK